MNPLPRRFLLGATAILVASLSAYYPALRGGFIWDDDDYVTANSVLRTTAGLVQIWTNPSATHQFYPLVHSAFWLEFHLWGLEPFGYHLVNVSLHASNAILFWLILNGLAVPGAWFAALVFALHPVHVESVAWITERKNVLSGFFYLASMLVYARAFLQEAPPAGTKKHKRRLLSQDAWDWKPYLLSLILFLCALLSKTVTCSLPAALFLLLWWKREKLGMRSLVPLIPFFLIGTGFGLITAGLEKHQVGAKGTEWAFSFLDRCLIAGRALWFYSGKLLFPSKLTFFYPRWSIDSGTWWQFLFPISAALVILILWISRNRLGKGPLVAVLFFAGTLAPALGFFDVYPMRFSFVADHFQYLASLGFIALVCAFLAHLAGKVSVRTKAYEKLAVTIVSVLLGILTWNQAWVYKDLETLYRDILSKNPAAWMAHQNLGALLLDQGKVSEAVFHIQKAARLKPDEAGAHSLLGLAYYQMGQPAEAEAKYLHALQLDPAQADALNNLAWLRATQSDPRFYDPRAAIDLAQRACNLGRNRKADYIDTLAAACAAAGSFEEAIQAESRAIELAHFYGQTTHANAYQQRLLLYRAGLPFRDSLPAHK